MPDGIADRLRRQAAGFFLRRKGFRNPAVGRGPAIGNRQQNRPDGPAKGSAPQIQRRGEIRNSAAEIQIQPADCFGKNRQKTLRMIRRKGLAEVFLPAESQTGQRAAVACHGDDSQGRIIMIYEIHRFIRPLTVLKSG